MRIIFAGFQHETNTFAPDLADDAAFAHGGGFPGLCRGADVITALVPTANIPGAGFLEAARGTDAEIVPILWCAACPSGFVARETYERIAGEIVEGIRAALPADAIYLDLHGAMVAEHVPDGEGELLARIRAITDTPVIVSLDLHANVTQRMIDNASALVCFRTYPHVDMAETGRRAFDLLQRRLAAGPFAAAVRRIPYLIPICWQATEEQPTKEIYARLAEIEATTGVTSLSWAMGFAAADFAECSPVVWAHAASETAARAAAEALAAEILAAESAFDGPLYPPEEAVAKALALNAQGVRPVVIADAQDNPGAGGSSDTMGLLRALAAARVPSAAIGVIHDPAAVAKASEAGIGAKIALSLGGKTGDGPCAAEFEVLALSDGKFETKGPYYGIRAMDLGASVLLGLGGIRIVVASEKAQLADREMFRYMGVTPEETDILVVKSAIHFRADFRPIAGEILTAVAPGAMMMRPTDWRWKHLPDGIRMMPGGPTYADTKASA